MMRHARRPETVWMTVSLKLKSPVLVIIKMRRIKLSFKNVAKCFVVSACGQSVILHYSFGYEIRTGLLKYFTYPDLGNSAISLYLMRF